MLQSDPFLDFDDSAAWVPGWQRPIHQALNRAIPKNNSSVASAELTSLFTGFFAQVAQRLKEGMAGGEAFKYLLRLIAAQFGEQDRGQAFTQLNDFGVPDGTTFSRFLQLFKVAVSNVTNYSGVLTPDDRWIVEIAINKLNDQFPGIAMVCFPGSLADGPVPYESLDDMWRVLDVSTTNRTAATNGARFSVAMVPAFEQLSLRSSAGSSRPSTRGASRGSHASSSHNRYVMHVQPGDGTDVFVMSYPAWPLGSDEHWETVFTVSASFSNQSLPPLWTPLTSKQDHLRAVKDLEGRCLNCDGAGQSMRQCTQPFTNTSGILNPQLGLLNDRGEAFQLWLQRMRSYKQSQPQNLGRSGTSDRSHPRPSGRRNDRRFNNDGRQITYSNNHTGHQVQSAAAAERFRSRHVQGYQQQQHSPTVSVYHPNSAGAAPTAVNNASTATGNRYHSLQSANSNPNRAPYTGRG